MHVAIIIVLLFSPVLPTPLIVIGLATLGSGHNYLISEGNL